MRFSQWQSMEGKSMAGKSRFGVVCFALTAVLAGPTAAQQTGRFLAPANQTIAVRAGRMFDARTGAMLANQVILIRGDRITDPGPNVVIPAGARVIDLSTATVM